jgi:hypothetical protein
VLESERETWRQVCEKLDAQDTRDARRPGSATSSPLVIDLSATDNMPYTGVSFEA